MRNLAKSFIAGEDLQEAVPVKITDGKVYKVTTVTDAVIGVTDSAVKAGKAADVIVNGIAFVQVDGAANAGDILVAKANGKAQKLTLALFSENEADTVIHTIGKLLDGDTVGAYLPAVITAATVIIPKQKTA